MSRLYFPFGVGHLISSGNGVQPGVVIKSGVEFRPQQQQGLYIRFNFDQRAYDFTNKKIQESNVSQGKLGLNDYVIGVGYHFGSKRFRPYSLVQGGVSVCHFPDVRSSGSNFIVQDKRTTTRVMKLTMGIEYYLARSTALLLETDYTQQFKSVPFWNKHSGAPGIDVGITTTLF